MSLSQALSERDDSNHGASLKEMKQNGFYSNKIQPVVHCKEAFEDNTGALGLAKVPKMRPRTKHILTVDDGLDHLR